jgi:tetratricopeptide (TPR) repeat protein
VLAARARLAAAHYTLTLGDQLTAYDQLAALLGELRVLDATLGGAVEVRTLIARTIGVFTQAQIMANQPRNPALSDELVALATILNNASIMALQALSAGRGLLYAAGRPDQARPFILQAERLFRQQGDVYFLALVSIDRGMLALLANDLSDAQSSFAEARTHALALHDRLGEAEASNNLGEIARLQGDDSRAETHYAASLRHYRDLGAPVQAQRAIHNLGYLRLHQGDAAQARAHFVASLNGVRAYGYVRGQAEAIAGLASIAASARQVAQAQQAARLWGAADALHTTIGTTAWRSDQAERARYEPLARGRLGDEAYQAAYAAGAALSLDNAVAEALGL